MIFKAKVYIKNPSEVPHGTKVIRGERGGLYYESNPTERARQWYSSLSNTVINPSKIPIKRTSNINNINLKYNLSLNIEARVIGKTIELGNKFNELTPQIKRFVLIHELAHLWTENDINLANAVISNPENAFGEVKTNRSGTYFNGIFGGINPEENFADAVVEYINNPNELKLKHNKAFEFINNIIPNNYKEQLNKLLSDFQIKQEDNITIISGDINDTNILDSLKTFSKEGNIEALPPPTKEQVQYWIKESGIPKDQKVVVVPYWSETVNAFCYLGGNTIYLLSNNEELDKDVLEQTRTECFKAGYDIKEMTLENRKIGTLMHEYSHIKTYRKAGITPNSEKDEARLHHVFQEYEEYIMKHFEKDQDTLFDFEVLLEILAEDCRISYGGKVGAFPHRYFYIDDKKDTLFQSQRLNILKTMGMI